MAKQQFNRRLSDEAIAAINWWAKQDSTPARKVTDTEIVERAIALYDQMRASGGEVPEMPAALIQSREVVQSLNRVPVEPAGRPLQQLIADGVVSRGVSAGFPCRCIHSGCRGSKFQGTSKYANLCTACQESGHSGEARGCQACFNDLGPA